MAYELKSARFLAREALERAVQAGDVLVDATMGNGHDTLFLAEQAGTEGRVYAFDIQEDAVASTRKLLDEHGVADRVVLLCKSHTEIEENVPGPIDAAVFNLGWLPGGDHRITTQCESTQKAVRGALNLLRRGGIVTVCVYPGHPEGERERDMLAAFFAALPNREYNVLRQTFPNAGEGAPECFVIQKL